MVRSRAVTLSWEGKEHGLAAVDAAGGTPRGPERTWTVTGGCGRLLEGDNLACLRSLAADDAGTVTLAYLDPPFFTNREHTAWLRKAGAPHGSARTRVPAFDDRWADQAAYLEAIAPRLIAARALLAPYGGQRQRVVRLIEISGARKPRFGPRYSPLDFRAM